MSPWLIAATIAFATSLVARFTRSRFQHGTWARGYVFGTETACDVAATVFLIVWAYSTRKP